MEHKLYRDAILIINMSQFILDYVSESILGTNKIESLKYLSINNVTPEVLEKIGCTYSLEEVKQAIIRILEQKMFL